MTIFLRFLKDESGATAIEYGLIAAGIAVAITLAIGTLGENLTEQFDAIAESIVAPPPAP